MGFSTNNRKGPMAEINVTPLVDVMLVLLVIFMVTAPMMFNGIKLTLPKTKKTHGLNLNQGQLIVSLEEDGKVYLGSELLTLSDLIIKLKNVTKDSADQVIFIRADFRIRYGEVAKLMSDLKNNGLTQIALVTEIDKDANN